MHNHSTDRRLVPDTRCVTPLQVSDSSAFGELLALCKTSVPFEHFAVEGLGIAKLGPGSGNLVATDLPPAFVDRILDEAWLDEDAVPVACKEASDIARPMDIIKVACRTPVMMTRLSIRATEFGLSVPYAIPVIRAGKVVGGVTFERPAPFSPREEQFLQLIATPLHKEALKLNPPDMKSFAITARELECMKLYGDGKTNDEIAGILDLSSQTIAFHIRNACTKLGALNKSSAVAETIRQGLME